ncbi:MAG: precorrin-6A reductase [Veillonellales bacterium]
MILVLAGTLDGRDLAALLARQGYQVLVSVVSEYGKDLALQENLPVHSCPLDRAGLIDFMQANPIKLVVDATHPYAVNISRNAIFACDLLAVPYLRYERSPLPLPCYDRLFVVPDYARAAQTAADKGNVVFLTTGSRMLATFISEPKLAQHRIVARVLPDPEVIRHCLELGLKPKDIIAMQGPFSQQLNCALFTAYQAEVVVTKESGAIGGSDTKLAAAISLNLPVVLISRPAIDYGRVVTSFQAALRYIEAVLQ